MAVNEDTSLPNRHIFVAAKTGGGKSQAMRNVIVPTSGARVIFWDPDKDHNCTHYTRRADFLRALAKADKAKRPFRLGWAGSSDKSDFSWWCDAVWRVLDGNYDTWIVTEELADLDMQNRALPEYNTLSKRSRKYGGILVGNTQRIQEVPKTFVTQAAEVWIGLHEHQDAVYIERMTGLKRADIESLEPLNFYKKSGGDWQKTAVKYKAFGKKSKNRNQFKANSQPA